MPKKNEEDALLRIGSEPIAKPKKNAVRWRKRSPKEMQHTVWLRRRQTFFYHTCDMIAQGGWLTVQTCLNEAQLELEELYETSSVECINVYRKNNTKDNGIVIIMIFKIGPIEKPVEGGQELKTAAVVGWWERMRRSLPFPESQ